MGKNLKGKEIGKGICQRKNDVHVTDESLNNAIKQFEQNTVLAS